MARKIVETPAVAARWGLGRPNSIINPALLDYEVVRVEDTLFLRFVVAATRAEMRPHRRRYFQVELMPDQGFEMAQQMRQLAEDILSGRASAPE